MMAKNKLTDEQLAAMIENGFGLDSIQFDNLATFEAASVAEKSMELIDEDVLQQIDFSFDTSCFRDQFEPLAMCGFLGDDEDEEISSTEDDNLEDSGKDDK